MRRTSINRLLCALALMIAMIAAGTGTASAYDCCTFSAEVTSLPAACFTITMTTSWGGIPTTHTLTNNVFYPNLSPGPCPPAPPFDWVSLDGGLTKVKLGQSHVVKLSATCCVTLKADLDASGCIIIRIDSTPC